MPYCTVEALRSILAPGLSDPADEPNERTNTAADLTNDELADAIAEAQSIIDVALAGRYVTPMAEPGGGYPAALKFWTRNIAAYLATCVQRGSTEIAPEDAIARRYALTMDALKQASDGTYVLPIPVNTGNTAVAGAGPVVQQRPGPLFTGNDLDLGPGWGWNWPYDAGRHYVVHPALNVPESTTDFFEQLQRGAEGQ